MAGTTQAGADQHQHPQTTREYARAYIGQGWVPIPIPARKKRPQVKQWQHLEVGSDPDQFIADNFSGSEGNCGVLLGTPSRGLIDIDLDTDEAVGIADLFLPVTGAIFGRPSKPGSHRFYRVKTPGPKEVWAIRGKNLAQLMGVKTGTTIVEYRSDGHQTIVPPSIHPSGERIEWCSSDIPAEVDGRELRACCARLAAACLLSLVFPPKGTRHEFVNAVAGGLLRDGHAQEHAERIIEGMCIAGGSSNPSTHVGMVELARRALEEGRQCTGWTTLEEHMPKDGIKLIRRWLGVPNPHPASRAPGAVGGYSPGEYSSNGQGWGVDPETASDPHARPTETDEEILISLPFTDYGNAQRLTRRYAGRIIYEHGQGKWYVWTGKRWAMDQTNAVMRAAKETAHTMMELGMRMHARGEDGGKALARHANESENRGRLEAMIALASSEKSVSVTGDDLDADPMKFNTESGVIDLATGRMTEHTPEDRITKLAPTEYRQNAQCPKFLEFMRQITKGDDDLEFYIQRLLGMRLSGDITEQVFPIFYGDGANGKSTLCDTIMGLMGDYATTAPPDLLVVRKGEPHPTELADLMGVRLVIAAETERGKHLRIQLVKQMTGDSRLKARRMRQDFFEFPRTFGIVMCTNNKPRITEDTNAVWRRIKLVPFNLRVADEDQNKNLLEEMRPEWPGILNWLVSGCVQWRETGKLGSPSAVETATEYYRESEDRAGEFFSEFLIFEDKTAWTASKELWSRYRSWCEEVGEKPIAPASFYDKLHARGCNKRIRNNLRGWDGVSMVAEPEPSFMGVGQ